MRWHSIQKKTIGEYTVHLVARPDRASGVIVQRQTPKGVWNGLAKFPPAVPSDDTMQHAIAMYKYESLETEVDIEDLIREWSDSDGDTLNELSEIEGQAAEGGLGDLPKLKKPRKPKPEKIEPPYSPRNYPKPKEAKTDKVSLLPNILDYDHIIVSFSGGKDSVACALLLLEMKVPVERIELWHQSVDGEPGKAERFWDWPVTEAYCEAFAKAFGFKLLFQWKDGGYLGELMRHNEPTASTSFQLPNGRTMTAGGEAEDDTRLAYPAKGSDLSKRWCSAYVKIDVAKKVFTNDPRFKNSKTLILTGERRQESTNRSKYENATDYMDPTKGSKKNPSVRVVHQWRAVLSWFEQDVWDIMRKYRVRPHPAYWLGWSRVSCLPCIFGDDHQWASVQEITPKVFNRMAEMEHEFRQAALDFPEHTWSERSQEERYTEKVTNARAIRAIAYPLFASGRDNEAVLNALKEQKLGKNQTENSMESLREEWKSREPYKPEKFRLVLWDGNLEKGKPLPLAASMGKSYITPELRKYVKLGMSEHYDLNVILEDGEAWEMPVGAGRGSGGPT